jgi:ribonuclease HI
MGSASFLLNYDYLMSDQSGIATNNKGKAISNPFVLTNQIYSTIPSEREDRSRKSWIPPTENSIRISVDAAFEKETGEAAIGVAARDHSEALVAALSQTTSRCQSVEEAEAKALLAGLQMGIDLNLNVSALESDCLAVVSAVNDPSPNRSIIWSIYKDISWRLYGHALSNCRPRTRTILALQP